MLAAAGGNSDGTGTAKDIKPVDQAQLGLSRAEETDGVDMILWDLASHQPTVRDVEGEVQDEDGPYERPPGSLLPIVSAICMY
jgi:hypothetical protein